MCDATQDAACDGALGEPVYLQLMRNTKGHQLSLHYNDIAVFKFRNFKSVFYEDFNTTSVLQRWQFVSDNGTMIINPAERRDAGTYRVEITEETTGRGKKHTVQLTIKGLNPVVPALVSLVFLLMCVCVAGGVFYFYRRKNTHTPAAPEELHYAVVDIIHRRQEDYEPSGPTQDCVYAQVQPRQ
ncbi:hypothetical protein AALO_G00190270 [Alosa alosa]|uniref:Uncharacterized protein n=1 Tax=Alosa alosa TaxID=278164 RepID=A0AAV6G5Y8_9TELE|nr:hypothetical protein AALO_G00190270 [Alosa alosa]